MAIVLGRKGGGSGGGGGGSVSEITSDDNSVTITNPTGPTVDLSASGGSLPFPVQSGEGFPTTAEGAVVPESAGALYFDTFNIGLWFASDATTDGWVGVAGFTGDQGVFSQFGPGNGMRLSAIGEEENIQLAGFIADFTMNPDGTGDWTGKPFTFGPGSGVIFPSADPGVAGAWWDNAGTLTRSSG